MKLEIKVGYSRTVNLGNTEFVRINTEINEEIETKDKRNYEEIFDQLFDECEHFVLKKCEVEIDKPKNDDIPF